MDAQRSERLFEAYLSCHGFKYERDFPVGKGNIDFRVCSGISTVFCDVKEVRDSATEVGFTLDAYGHIRSDIQKLREKFGKHRPEEPCVLVSVNSSSNFFTGLTVARAMLGDVAVDVCVTTKKIVSGVHFPPRGNAKMTKKQNTSISGILVLDSISANHCLFTNPFAQIPVPEGFFSEVRTVPLARELRGPKLTALSNLMFWCLAEGTEPTEDSVED